MIRRRKLLVIGLDGVRGDTMRLVARRRGSAVGALAREGAWSFRALTAARSVSGPAWTSALTGVWGEKHGVVDNEFHPSNLDAYPPFLHRLDGRRVGSVVNWAPLNERLLGRDGMALVEDHPSDARVCARVVDLLAGDRELDALFVHLDEVDAWGHRAGYSSFSPFYRRAVARADRMVGAMLGALRARPGVQWEDWLVIVTSDHGGRWFTHGRDDEANRRVPLIMWGDRVRPGPLAEGAAVVDVAATALEHVEGGIRAGWELDGVVRTDGSGAR